MPRGSRLRLPLALPHLANPEVAGEDLVRIVGYVAIGYVWAWVTLRDRTLELAIGAHAANNISAALLVGYVGSAIPSLSLDYGPHPRVAGGGAGAGERSGVCLDNREIRCDTIRKVGRSYAGVSLLDSHT
ncbi:MAG: CPBP family intramembrane glutamic endopeptidase [Candidatus Limnocylindrus sp.]